MSKQFISEIPGRPLHPQSHLHSPAVRAGDFVFLSARAGAGHDDQGKIIEGIEAKTRNCLEKAKATLQAAGASLEDVVRVVIILKDPVDYDKVNEVFRSYFPKDPPVRTTHVGTGIHGFYHGPLEMEFTAYCTPSKEQNKDAKTG